mmetsp:Transcript_17660/g.26448  ORF Transcript_17660/g.26448 Transcript_17660/m.26448 type:complete len:114 (+) Transcript_17660:3195-3536(+)
MSPKQRNINLYHRLGAVCLFSFLLLQQLRGTRGSLFPPRTVLTWVNGIGFNINHMNNGQINISSIFGNRPVLFCHNPTAMTNEDDTMGWVGDFTQATTQKLGKITTEVDELVR